MVAVLIVNHLRYVIVGIVCAIDGTVNSYEPLQQLIQNHFYMKSTKIKSWEKREADMTVKVEMWQDGPNAFEVLVWKLGASTPINYRFDNLNSASNWYSLFIARNDPSTPIESLMQAEIEALHKLCVAAQCWLDAAGHLANGHETKCALQRNADEFRQEYAKITS